MDEEVVHVSIEDRSGSLGIRPGHAPLVTALVQGIVTVRLSDQSEVYVAVDGGVAVVTPDQVRVASRQAVTNDNLRELEETVLKRFLEQTEQDRASHVAFEKMRMSFIREVLDYEKTGERL
jgi:F-type H+-transporting ATPase subunit epsilon